PVLRPGPRAATPPDGPPQRDSRRVRFRGAGPRAGRPHGERGVRAAHRTAGLDVQAASVDGRRFRVGPKRGGEMAGHVADYFTVPGRVLVLLTLLLAVGGTWGYVAWAWDDLPTGGYPLWLFALPVLVGSGLLFALGAAALRWFGV